MDSFKKAAEEVLRKAGEPLHYKEITKRAIKSSILKTTGKTPWATMNAVLSVDIKKKGHSSIFYRSQPGCFGIKSNGVKKAAKTIAAKAVVIKHTIAPTLGSKQKGDIAEARVAELIMLYGNKGLSCYKPISDDEGIDLIVKKRQELKALYLQIKSRFGFGENGSLVQTPKTISIGDSYKMALVFVYFDLASGDIADNLWFIPAPDFLKIATTLSGNESKKRKERKLFQASLKHPDKGKFAPYLIEKRELANKILEIMKKI